MELPFEPCGSNTNLLIVNCCKTLKTSDQPCCVCLEIQPDWHKYELSCKHQMHTRCCRKWFQTKKDYNCPLCGPLDKIDYCELCDGWGKHKNTCDLRLRNRFKNRKSDAEKYWRKDGFDTAILVRANYHDLYKDDKSACVQCHAVIDFDEAYTGIIGKFISCEDQPIDELYMCKACCSTNNYLNEKYLFFSDIHRVNILAWDFFNCDEKSICPSLYIKKDFEELDDTGIYDLCAICFNYCTTKENEFLEYRTYAGYFIDEDPKCICKRHFCVCSKCYCYSKDTSYYSIEDDYKYIVFPDRGRMKLTGYYVENCCEGEDEVEF